MISSKWESVAIKYSEPGRSFTNPAATQQIAQVKSIGQDHAPQAWRGGIRDLTTDFINLSVDIPSPIPAAVPIRPSMPECDFVNSLCFRDDVKAAFSGGPPGQARVKDEPLTNPLGPRVDCTDSRRQPPGERLPPLSDRRYRRRYLRTRAFETLRAYICVYDGIILVEDWSIE